MSYQVPNEMQAGSDQAAILTLKNTGDTLWSSKQNADGVNEVLISYHWYTEEGVNVVVWDGARTEFPHDIAPDEMITVNNVHIVAPNQPGVYRLRVALVHEGVIWFEKLGADQLAVTVTVH